MAVGDVVSNINGTGGNNFQPASGVEIIVLSSFVGTSASWYVGIMDGTNQGQWYNHYSGTDKYVQSVLGNKIAINNTNYYYNSNSAGGFSGIQIK